MDGGLKSGTRRCSHCGNWLFDLSSDERYLDAWEFLSEGILVDGDFHSVDELLIEARKLDDSLVRSDISKITWKAWRAARLSKRGGRTNRFYRLVRDEEGREG
jgi:hypothetical protein